MSVSEVTAKDYQEEIKALFEGNYTPEQIATELELELKSVYSALAGMGIKVHKQNKNPGNLNDDQVKALIELYQRGDITTTKLTNQFDITYPQLYKVMRDNGIELRSETDKEDNDAKLNKAVDLYVKQPDLPLWKIKVETGLGESTIIREVHRRGLPTRKELREEAEMIAINGKYGQRDLKEMVS